MIIPRSWFANLCTASKARKRLRELFPIIEWAPKVRFKIFPFFVPTLKILNRNFARNNLNEMLIRFQNSGDITG